MKNESIILVDVSTILHRLRLTKQDKLYGVELLNSIETLKRQIGSDKVILVQDFLGSRYRKEIYPMYKAHRNNKELNSQEQEKLDIMRTWNNNLDIFKNFFKSVKVRGVECDDIACILYYKLKQEGYFPIIATVDKDYLTAIPYSSLYNINKGRFYTKEDRKNLSMGQFVMFMTLFGDSSDNIPSFCGEKSALVLVNNFSNFKEMREYTGDINNLVGVTSHNKRHIIMALEKIKTDSGWEQLKLNYNLISIFRDTNKLNEEELQQFNKIYKEIINMDDFSYEITEELEDFLDKYELETLMYMEEIYG